MGRHVGHTDFLKIQLKISVQNDLIFGGEKSGKIYSNVIWLILGGGVISDNLDT